LEVFSATANIYFQPTIGQAYILTGFTGFTG
jgi:hypothetical protein